MSSNIKAVLIFVGVIALTFGEGEQILGLFISLLLVFVFIWSFFSK